MSAHSPLVRRVAPGQDGPKQHAAKSAASRAPKRGPNTYPYRSQIEAGLDVRLPGSWQVDAEACRRMGVPGFTDGLTSTFASADPSLHVAAHEATHTLPLFFVERRSSSLLQPGQWEALYTTWLRLHTTVMRADQPAAVRNRPARRHHHCLF